MSTLRWFLLGAVLILLPLSDAWAHGGGLDGYGCHHNRKAGGYHCHRGPFAGQAFTSQADMLQQLEHREAPQNRSAPTNPDETCVEEKGTGRVVCGRVVK